MGGIERRTSTFVAIFNMSRGSIVSSTYDTVVPDQDTANPSFHTIAPLRSEGCQLHEVLIPAWPQALFISEIERLQGSMQFF